MLFEESVLHLLFYSMIIYACYYLLQSCFT